MTRIVLSSDHAAIELRQAIAASGMVAKVASITWAASGAVAFAGIVRIAATS